jgi:hypothetical protein
LRRARGRKRDAIRQHPSTRQHTRRERGSGVGKSLGAVAEPPVPSKAPGQPVLTRMSIQTTLARRSILAGKRRKKKNEKEEKVKKGGEQDSSSSKGDAAGILSGFRYRWISTSGCLEDGCSGWLRVSHIAGFAGILSGFRLHLDLLALAQMDWRSLLDSCSLEVFSLMVQTMVSRLDVVMGSQRMLLRGLQIM